MVPLIVLIALLLAHVAVRELAIKRLRCELSDLRRRVADLEIHADLSADRDDLIARRAELAAGDHEQLASLVMGINADINAGLHRLDDREDELARRLMLVEWGMVVRPAVMSN
jgi:hypothetical protein